MIIISKKVQIILIITTQIYLLVFTSVNLFKTEYDDPPFNYLTRHWLNSPIEEIEILNISENKNIKEYDNQKNLGYFKSDSVKKDLNIFMDKYFKIKLYTPYYYPNFVGFFKEKNKQICGKDSQGNLLYFPKDKKCPINFIVISDNLSFCESLNIACSYKFLKEGQYLITSNEYKEGEIITQLRINYNNIICADSSVDLTFNNLLNNYENQKCDEDYGYDTIYHKIGEENVRTFLEENNINNINIKNNDNIFLSYRGYLGVDNIDDFSEHPVDHVTYAKTIAFSKNIVLFISCFFFLFCSIFILYFGENERYKCKIKIILIIYCILIFFNFFYDFHVIFTFIRVKGIVKTVNLEGVKKYKNGLRWFIITDIFILFGIIFDFILKLLQFLMFRQKYKISDDNQVNLNKDLQI